MRFTVDPWDPSYGTSLGSDLEPSRVEPVLGVEMPVPRWAPVDPTPGVVAPSAVLFVDGVRRTDAQLWVDEPDGTASPALCASYAAGVVCCCPEGGAHLVHADVRRSLVTSAASGVDIATSAGTYECTRVEPGRPGEDPGRALSVTVQVRMQETELAVATRSREEHGTDDDLLVVDGPLGRRHPPRALGLIKTHATTYLPAEVGGIVAALRAGQRTPVFRLERPESDRALHRHTWYLRLPCPPGAPWAGIARVECGGDLPAEQAVALADTSQATLARYASSAYKDSRAPQNLYPIAGLERALRRRLGEPALLYRALRRAAA
ncbi:hypothetical protein [Pseudonocardia sp.]|uniref:hypothetical protein n=1 Tax=Pseudonocardia sp. TaxID=60912 RepID=UPI0026261348|nr:hypothetical protein [Pseudonocardia sp.]